MHMRCPAIASGRYATSAGASLTVCAVFGTMTTVPSNSPKDWHTSMTCRGSNMAYQRADISTYRSSAKQQNR